MNRWLADFVYRIEAELGIFMLAGRGMLLVAIVNCSIAVGADSYEQTIKKLLIGLKVRVMNSI